MPCTIFYSWQSDLPNATNRGFIQTALENAAKAIRDDDSIQVEPVVERDTQGTPGSPDIAGTILAKIEQCQVFVCDVSIINQTLKRGAQHRPTPNPNVLLELGYALKTLGLQRIVMVLNTEFGEVELLPFDLRMKRVVRYAMKLDANDRSSERRELEKKLEEALRVIFESLEADQSREPETLASVTGETMQAVSSLRPNQDASVRQFMRTFAKELDVVAPEFPGLKSEDEPDELLVHALVQTEPLLLEFGRLAECIAVNNAADAVASLYKDFGQVLERYETPSGFSGHYSVARFDFFKFLGHEMFVAFVSLLIRESRWTLIGDLLSSRIFVRNTSQGEPGLMSFEYIAQAVSLLSRRKTRLNLNRVSVHADILNERHTAGPTAELVPMSDFVSADFFLFLRSPRWRPISTIYMEGMTPRYLFEALEAGNAQRLLTPLGLDSVQTLRNRVAEASQTLRYQFRDSAWFEPLRDFRIDAIGTL